MERKLMFRIYFKKKGNPHIGHLRHMPAGMERERITGLPRGALSEYRATSGIVA